MGSSVSVHYWLLFSEFERAIAANETQEQVVALTSLKKLLAWKQRTIAKKRIPWLIIVEHISSLA